MLGKLIRSLYYILFFTVPLIVIPTTSELFELNKMMVIYSVALLVFCLGATDVVLHGKNVIKRTPLDIPIAIFLGVMVLSLLFSIDRHTSFFGYYGRFNGGVLSIIAYIVLYYGIAWYFLRKDVITLLRVSVVTSSLVMVWGLSGKVGFDFSCLLFTGQFNNSCWTDQFRPAERMFSTLGQPNWLAAYLAAHFFIARYLYLTQKPNRRQLWIAHIPYAIYLVLNLTCLLFTRSRSGLIAWGCGAAIFITYYVLRRRHMYSRPLASVAIACLIVILVFKTGISQIDRFITFPKTSSKPAAPVVANTSPPLPSEVTESFDIRKIVWSGAWELGKRYPILGTGPETFGYSYYFVRPQAHNMTSEWDFIYNKAHNEYLNYLATTGFVGLIAYLGLIVAFFYMVVKQFSSYDGDIKSAQKKLHGAGPIWNPELFIVCFVASYSTILTTNFFGFSTSTVQLLFFLMPALAWVALTNQQHKAHNPSALGFRQYAELAGIGVVGVVSIFWIISFIAADLHYSQGVTYLSQGDYPEAAIKLKNALSLHHEHVYEDRYSTALANIALLVAYSQKPEEAENYVFLSRYYSSRALEQSPQNALYWRSKGKNEYTFYQAKTDEAYINEAIKDIDKAYKFAPTDPKLPYTLGLLYGATNRREQSMRYMDQTIALKPDYLDAYLLKLKLLKAWKEDEQVKTLKTQIKSRFPMLPEKRLDEEFE